MSHTNTDEGRNRSQGASNGRRNFLRNSTCPDCDRKGALTWNRALLPDDVAHACRYCKYAVLREDIL